MYDLHRLRLLRELSLRGTLAAVAQALGYSPSAVSHQLSVLERETGVPLLEPVGRRVRLTPAAERLVMHTENILDELERAQASVAASRSEVSGHVRIAAFQSAGRAMLPGVVRRLSSQHPALRVTFAHISADAAVLGLLARDFDVVLSERYPGEPSTAPVGVRTTVLLSDKLFLAVPADWPVGSLSDLATRPWVMEHAGSSVRRWTDSVCRGAGFEPSVMFESADVYLHAQLVTEGLAAAFLPGLSLRAQSEFRTVEVVAARSIELSVRQGSDASPVIATVTSALKDQARGFDARA
ncbi:LysR family transcriptional regulator [Microbacterium enclense]|nr:LysR family transcriptional regulator [Microbacterium enclense]